MDPERFPTRGCWVPAKLMGQPPARWPPACAQHRTSPASDAGTVTAAVGPRVQVLWARRYRGSKWGRPSEKTLRRNEVQSDEVLEADQLAWGGWDRIKQGKHGASQGTSRRRLRKLHPPHALLESATAGEFSSCRQLHSLAVGVGWTRRPCLVVPAAMGTCSGAATAE